MYSRQRQTASSNYATYRRNNKTNSNSFIHRDIEEADQDTRRKTSIDLVKALMRFQEDRITDILMKHVQVLWQNANSAQGSTQQRLLAKESCIYVVMAMAVKGATKMQGCTIMNQRVELNVNKF